MDGFSKEFRLRLVKQMRQNESFDSAEILKSMEPSGDAEGGNRKTTVKELKAVLGKVQHPTHDFTEIIPHLYLGGITTAKSVKTLKSLGITHILNAAYDPTGKGNFIYVETNEEYFKNRNYPVKYLGTRAPDTMRFKINKFFPETIPFIEEGISSGGKVYVHCYMGISRSATYVLVYLMTKLGMSAMDAVKFVRAKREIFPNDGFLQIILDYEDELKELLGNESADATPVQSP